MTAFWGKADVPYRSGVRLRTERDKSRQREFARSFMHRDRDVRNVTDTYRSLRTGFHNPQSNRPDDGQHIIAARSVARTLKANPNREQIPDRAKGIEVSRKLVAVLAGYAG
jgi:hypothetical protein